MPELTFAVAGAQPEPYAAVPTLSFRVDVTEHSGEEIHSLALRCQIQIETQRRAYSAAERDRLYELFGEPARWGETVRPLMWSQTGLVVPGFRGATAVTLPLQCTYDFEVIAAKYLQALDDGEIPLLFLWSGTIFSRAASGGFTILPVPWEKEAAFRLPVRVWRQAMDRFFPGCAWIRLQRESLDALHRFKGRRALPTWDDAVAALLGAAGEEGPR